MLNRDYGKVVIRDGKTGSDLYNDLATNKFLLPLLDRNGRLGVTGRVSKDDAKDEPRQFQQPFQTYYFELAGEALPFFQQHQIALRHDQLHQFKLIDRAKSEEKWSQGLTRTMFGFIISQAHQTRFSYMTLGHLIVLPVGHMVFGIDPVNQKVLWERNLHSPDRGPQRHPGFRSAAGPASRSSRTRSTAAPSSFTPKGWRQRLGQTGPLEGSVICLQAREGLMGVDPLTGRILWSRSDIGSRSKIFGDGDTVYVVEMDEHNVPSVTRGLRASDGVAKLPCRTSPACTPSRPPASSAAPYLCKTTCRRAA